MIESFAPAKVTDAEFISIVHVEKKCIYISITIHIYAASPIGGESKEIGETTLGVPTLNS